MVCLTAEGGRGRVFVTWWREERDGRETAVTEEKLPGGGGNEQGKTHGMDGDHRSAIICQQRAIVTTWGGFPGLSFTWSEYEREREERERERRCEGEKEKSLGYMGGAQWRSRSHRASTASIHHLPQLHLTLSRTMCLSSAAPEQRLQ